MKANAKQNASDYIMDHYPTDNEDLSPTEIVDKDPATQEDDDFATQKEKDYDPPPKSPQGDLLRGGARNSSQEIEIELILNTGEMYPIGREKRLFFRVLRLPLDEIVTHVEPLIKRPLFSLLYLPNDKSYKPVILSPAEGESGYKAAQLSCRTVKFFCPLYCNSGSLSVLNALKINNHRVSALSFIACSAHSGYNAG